MKKPVLSTLAFLAAVYLAMVVWMYFAQRSLMYFPNTETPDLVLAGYSDMAVVTTSTEDGLELFGWYKAALPGQPTIVYFHGNAGNLFNHSRIARPLIEAGYGVLLVEYRGYGGNAGSPTEDGLYADGRAAIEFLKAQGLAEKDMVLFGQSLGTGIAVKMAAEIEVRALILQSPYTSIADVAQSIYWYMPVKLLVKDRFDSQSIIGGITTPVLIFYGEEDRIIPAKFSIALYGAANEPKSLESIANAGHNDLGENGSSRLIVDFLEAL